MIDRVLDITEQPARLCVRNGLLIVETGNSERAAIPCSELAAVVLGHRQVTLTQSVLSELARAGTLLVTCDEKCAPASMVLPLVVHHAQAERFRRQAAMPLPKKKRLWQSIIKAKIAAQAGVLESVTGSDEGLRALARTVRSGDPGNVEARAARRYWSRLFGDDKFHRHDPEDSRNWILNYGYAVLRSITGRAICGAGLHPSFPLYHSSAHNPFGLADDLMEPFRPLVDRLACSLSGAEIDTGTKSRIVEALLSRYSVEGEERSLPDILNRVAGSLQAAVMGERDKLWLPEIRPLRACLSGG